ncbi:hypothetical protein [Solilutibacter silvestris]|uniref:hypothetical protein n=1 Tax=Solilutibacter silvestris TaxID=1645665 RepID=UPI003D3430F0
MKRGIFAAFVLAVMACPVMKVQAEDRNNTTVVQASAETVMTMRVRGEIMIGSDGLVKSHRIETQVDPKIAEFVDKTIAGWKFQPFVKDGVPIVLRGKFQMTLGARAKDADNYVISVDNARFNEISTSSMQDVMQRAADLGKDGKLKCENTGCLVSQPRSPVYPTALVQAGVSGSVMTHLYVNPNGTVADAVVAQSTLYNVRGDGKTLDDARKQLEEVALKFVRGVKFSPGSGAKLGDDDHFAIAFPIEFHIQGAMLNNEGVWRLEQRSRRNVASWLVRNPDRWIGVSDVAGSVVMPMIDSKIKLVSDKGSAAP